LGRRYTCASWCITRSSFTEEQQKAGILRRGLWGVVRRRPPLGSSTASQAGETGQINAPSTGERIQYSNRLRNQKNLQMQTRLSDITIDPAKQPTSYDKPRDIKQKQYICQTQQQQVVAKKSMLKQHQSTAHQVFSIRRNSEVRTKSLPKFPMDCRAKIPNPTWEQAQNHHCTTRTFWNTIQGTIFPTTKFKTKVQTTLYRNWKSSNSRIHRSKPIAEELTK